MQHVPSNNGVMLIGEALGADEAEAGTPFVGAAGYRLNRLIEWAGFKREDFGLTNCIWCRPPENRLEGQPYETAALSHCRQAHLQASLAGARVLLPMGNTALGAITGQRQILTNRGYLSRVGEQLVIGTVHPSFIQRGNAKWSAAFINDLQKSVEAATCGVPPQVVDYLVDPTPHAAYRWAEEYRQWLSHHPEARLAFDIETPGKDADEDESDISDDAPDRTWRVDRIGFSYRGMEALSIEWLPEYMAAIRLLLSSSGEKIVWNAGFDVPRIQRAGVGINGLIHDAMVAWHILHSDLPKSLRFAATFTCPWQSAWKHLSGSRPGFYNATDADVEWRSMAVIERELRKSGLWEVYQRDVIDLEPILLHMQQRGLLVDAEVRLDRANKLATKLAAVKAQIEALIPREVRKIDKVFKTPPADTSGLESRPGVQQVRVCPHCDSMRPRKEHFKVFVKKTNPCGGLSAVSVERPFVEYYRLAECKISRDLLIRYHQHRNRPLPMVYDRKERRQKVSFNEENMKKLILKYPLDKLYELVLEYRGYDKLANTYIGRPVLV